MAETRPAPRSAGRKLSDVFVVLSFVAIALAVVMTMSDIALRLAAQGAEMVLGTRPRWSIAGVVDLMQLFTVTAVSLAIAANFLTDSHIRIDLLLNRMGPRLRTFSVVISALTGVAVIGICLWSAVREFQGQLEFTSSSATLALPFTWYWAPLILGLAISLACCLWQLIRPGQKAEDDIRDYNV